VETPTARRAFTNVVVGEVWLCTGQSNMRWMLKQTTDAAGAGDPDPELRLLNFVPDYKASTTASNYFRCAGWQSARPATAADFSAVGMHFGRMLRRELGVPVGLVLNAVGGAPIEAFLPDLRRGAAWLGDTNYPGWCRERARQEMTSAKNNGFHIFGPAALHDAGFASLQPYALRGVLWYQGESNASDTPEQKARDPAPYARMFTGLVRDWRAAWKDPQLAVLTVQLPGLNREWAAFREMQAQVARSIPAVGMAVTIDLGHPTDVHPRNKRTVGERLARIALAGPYGRNIPASGPTYVRHEIRRGEVFVTFANAEGLCTRDGGAPMGFELADADGVFHAATARIETSMVRAASPEVPAPTALRYAWGNDPANNLRNAAGLPAEPFRLSLNP
jgi:sialate O-acetylesterase